jgi:hypothetical protein
MYRAIYRVVEKDKRVEVLHIRHGARREFKGSDVACPRAPWSAALSGRWQSSNNMQRLSACLEHFRKYCGIRSLPGRGSESDLRLAAIQRAETGDKIAGATGSGQVRTSVQKL